MDLPNFENDFVGAKGLFENIYKRIHTYNPLTTEEYVALGFDSDEKLQSLFAEVYYHPLLIEQLAAFGAINPKKMKHYQELCDVVSKDKIKNYSTQSINDYSICYVDKEKTIDVCIYLQQLISFRNYDGLKQYILKHFVLWPYDYIPEDVINKLLYKKGEYLEREMMELVDELVLSQSDKGFRLHGLLGDVLRNELYDEEISPTLTFIDHFISQGDYDNYIDNIRGFKPNSDITKQCINQSLGKFLIADNNFSVYKDISFFDGICQYLKFGFPKSYTEIWELGCKVKLLNRLYPNYSSGDIYQTVKNTYKDQSSHLVYYDWLEKQRGYGAEPPSDGIVNLKDKEGKIIHSFKMIKVDGGEFMMGGRGVSLSDFYIGETQVTQGLWEAVMGKDNNPSSFKNGDNYPVENVSWYDCLNFIMELNKRTGFKFRLPTEAQWEFAARGGTKKTRVYNYSGSDKLSEVAWYGNRHKEDKNRTATEATTHEVRGFKANDLGIYDMSGNVWEWCQDWYGEYNEQDEQDPHGPTSGSKRVVRGGSYFDNGMFCRVNYRVYSSPVSGGSSCGLRLALSVPQ